MAKKKLTPKQKLFVEYYLQHWNATLAAKQAGYKAKSYAAFGVIGCENLIKLNIKAKIKERFVEVAMQTDEALARLGAMARSFDMTKYIEFKEMDTVIDGVAVFSGYAISFDLERLQKDGFSHLVKEIKQNGRGGIDIKWHDQMAALALVEKHNERLNDREAEAKKVIKVSIV